MSGVVLNGSQFLLQLPSCLHECCTTNRLRHTALKTIRSSKKKPKKLSVSLNKPSIVCVRLYYNSNVKSSCVRNTLRWHLVPINH